MPTLGYEGQLIVNFLKTSPEAFFSAMEIARKAGQKGRFRDDTYWTRPILSRLVDEEVVEVDAFGHYRLARKPERKPSAPLAPHIAEILARSGKVFDLTALFEETPKANPTEVV